MDVIYPSRMAAILLAQHHELRELLDAAVGLARASPAPGAPMLQEVVARLQAELERHNRLEDRLLEPLLRAADAWGAERIDQMVGHHHAEHAALEHQLRLSISLVDADAAMAAMDELAAALRRHMDLEEREFLNANVLRDDVVALDASGG